MFREAEAGGCVQSSNYLGKIFLKGEGVRKDIEKAYQVTKLYSNIYKISI